MRTGRPKALLTMSSDERAQLLAITRSRSLPAALTLRAKIVLACEREPSNAAVAARLYVAARAPDANEDFVALSATCWAGARWRSGA